jgi:hypothetical protein
VRLTLTRFRHLQPGPSSPPPLSPLCFDLAERRRRLGDHDGACLGPRRYVGKGVGPHEFAVEQRGPGNGRLVERPRGSHRSRAVEVAGPEVALATGLGIEVGRRIEVDRAGSFVPAGTTIAQGDDLGVVETRAGGVATGLAATGTATRTVVFPLLVSFVGFLVVSLIVDRGVGESRGIDLFSRPPPCFRTGPALVFVSLAARGTRAVVLVTGVPG